MYIIVNYDCRLHNSFVIITDHADFIATFVHEIHTPNLQI